MKDSRINQVRTHGNFVIISLTCGHAIKQRAAWWNRHPGESLPKVMHCPQCRGYK